MLVGNGEPVAECSDEGPPLGDLLSSPAPLEQRLRCCFREVAQAASGHVGPMLRYEDVIVLGDRFAEELGAEPRIFREMGQFFWRFDFFGDGLLNEEEGVRLFLYMLRRYRDGVRLPFESHMQFQLEVPYCNIYDLYTIEEQIGCGGQAYVALGTSKQTGQRVTVKMKVKAVSDLPEESLTHEFKLLTTLRHPKIARVYDIFQDFENLYLVQEPYMGGTLCTAVQRAVDSGVETGELWLSKAMRQVLVGLAFLHSRYIMHCDLKETNVMVAGEANWESPQLVLIDFGMAHEFAAIGRPGGTPGYMPPEVWEQALWTPKGDVFSFGVMLFSVWTGCHPFWEDARTLPEVKRRTCEEALMLDSDSSAELQALVLSTTEKCLHRRPSISHLLEEEAWFQSVKTLSSSRKIDATVLESVARRREKNLLRKALLTDIISRRSLSQMRALNELFLELDINGDGMVSAEELRQALSDLWSPEDIDRLVAALVSDNWGISYEEFMSELISVSEPAEGALLAQAFSEADRHSKGYLVLGDVRSLLRRSVVAQVLGDVAPEKLLQEMDPEGKGYVSFFDFQRTAHRHRFSRSGLKCAIRAWFNGRWARAWRQGDEVEFFSTADGAWIPTAIAEVDADSGALQLRCMLGIWLRGVEVQTRLRRPRSTIRRLLAVLDPRPLLHAMAGVRKACVSGRLCS
mmetsp:Transcript_123442/g.356912  ORF Transcript_123442/g.356912 Transcript_123442/m.356912 type:complete len:687 (-) Transcript_123442:87-2147(-)